MHKAIESSGDTPMTLQQLFERTLPTAAKYYSQVVATYGAGALALARLDAESSSSYMHVEDILENVDSPSASQTGRVPKADEKDTHGSLADAVWELLSLTNPTDLTPVEIAEILNILTSSLGNSKYTTQDNLPPAWQAHSQLLHDAFRGGAKPAIVKFCSPHINQDDSSGSRPIHVAVEIANCAQASENISALIAEGADVNAVDNNGFTALCLAAQQQAHILFTRLVAAGACGGQHTWVLLEYRKILRNLPGDKTVNDASISLDTITNVNRKLAWYFSWSASLPSTTNRADCIFQTESFSSCMVSANAKTQLFRSDGAFNSATVFGRRLVGKVGQGKATCGDLFLKVRPELPGVEIAVRELARRLFGVNAMPYAELVRWSKKVPGTKSLGPGTPVLISQGVAGPTLAEVISAKDTSIQDRTLKNLEPESLSEALILALLTMPEDGKPDNYICEPTETGQYRLIGIDNDHAFAPPVATERGHKELKVKCCLFCLDQMMDQIAPKCRKTLLYVKVNLSCPFLHYPMARLLTD